MVPREGCDLVVLTITLKLDFVAFEGAGQKPRHRKSYPLQEIFAKREHAILP